MFIANYWRRLALALLAGCAVAVISLPASIAVGSLTPAMAQASEEFQEALEPYGAWRKHPRFGEVWAPAGVPRDWRPYESGHWVYTEEWGWYWVSDDAEQDWGWVTYHYGRWVHDRGAWFWVPGEDWAPAWVDWRYGDEYIGWSPLPPDDLIDSYASEPAYWMFVPGRYMTAPRLRTYYLLPQRRVIALRATRIVNRTVAVRGARIAVNPGISPNFVARVTRTALPTFRVQPRVFVGTQGVSGAVQVRREDLRTGRQPAAAGRPRVNAVSVQRTTVVIQAAPTATAPQALGKDERGRLGTHPPRAAQSGAPGAAAPQAPAAPPPAGAPPRPGQRPGQPPAVAPAAPLAVTPPRPEPPRPAPREERRDQRPPAAAAPAGRPGEPPPQAKPERPIAPQTPPPPPPAQSGPRQAPPPAAVRPAPPPRPVPPAVKPAAPPPPAAKPAAPPPAKKEPLKPGEKKPEETK